MLTEAQIQQFVEAMKGPAPAYDPDWEATRRLLSLAAVQARQIISLQAQLDALLQSNTVSTQSLISGLQRTADGGIARNNLSLKDVQDAASNLQTAIDASVKGEKAAGFAANILRFAVKLVLPL